MQCVAHNTTKEVHKRILLQNNPNNKQQVNKKPSLHTCCVSQDSPFGVIKPLFSYPVMDVGGATYSSTIKCLHRSHATTTTAETARVGEYVKQKTNSSRMTQQVQLKPTCRVMTCSPGCNNSMGPVEVEP